MTAVRYAAEHDLKTWPEFFQAIVDRKKRFELRKNDRGFHDGDVLLLREWSVASGYTGRAVRAEVTYIVDGIGLPGLNGLVDGHVVMSINVFQEIEDFQDQ